MPDQLLKVHAPLDLNAPRLLIGLFGWMDGGDVSTGVVQGLVERLDARPIASIDADPFYIYNFPGSMELSALFRPHVNLTDGLVQDYREPTNTFYSDPANDLILFVGKEPHLHWQQFTRLFFQFAQQAQVQEIYFVGSFAGLVPHSREPKLSGSVSSQAARDKMAHYHLHFSDYEGPASISTYMLQIARNKQIDMTNLVAEIPAYIEGRNPRCIEAMMRRVVALLGIDLNLDDLRLLADEFERRVNEVVTERDDLAQHIRKLEEIYDQELFDTEMPDLRNWLQQRGIRLD